MFALISSYSKCWFSFTTFREEGDYEIAPLLDTIIDTAKREVNAGETLSQEVGDVTAVAVGGFHTTGTVLTWMIYYLTIHPAIQDKVTTELQNILGDKDITEDAIKSLTYVIMATSYD